MAAAAVASAGAVVVELAGVKAGCTGVVVMPQSHPMSPLRQGMPITVGTCLGFPPSGPMPRGGPWDTR